MTWSVWRGDALIGLKHLKVDTFDAIITDPPYGLKFMGKDWDKALPDPAIWVETLRTFKSGAYMVSLGAPRLYHRLACQIEDAGWEIRDCFSWLYGSGFPKSKDSLKPAWEPILLARKPGASGALNIEACRVGGNRWPANVILDEVAATSLDVQSGILYTGGGRRNSPKKSGILGAFGGDEPERSFSANSGGASRFFYCAKASRKERDAGLKKRNLHPTVKPIALMRWLVRLVTPADGLVLDPFAGSGSTGVAVVCERQRFLGMESNAIWVDVARKRIAHQEAGLEDDE